MTPPSPRGGLALIAVFKLLKGVVLLLVGIYLASLYGPVPPSMTTVAVSATRGTPG